MSAFCYQSLILYASLRKSIVLTVFASCLIHLIHVYLATSMKPVSIKTTNGLYVSPTL